MWILAFQKHGGLWFFWTGKSWSQSFVLAKRFKRREEAENQVPMWGGEKIIVVSYGMAYHLMKRKMT